MSFVPRHCRIYVIGGEFCSVILPGTWFWGPLPNS